MFFTPDEWRAFLAGVSDPATWLGYLAKRRRFGVVKIGPTSDSPTMRRSGAGICPGCDRHAELGHVEADRYRERLMVWRGVWIALLESGGSRLSEILTLTWSQIDLKAGVAIIRQGKTGRPKTIPIGGDWRADLEAKTRGIGDALVYTHPDGSPLTDRQAARAFATWRAVAGLRRQLTIHKIRHTAASWMTQANAPDRQVQDALGHADARMTKRYAHLKPEHLAAAFAGLTAIKNTTTNETAEEGSAR